MADEKSLEQAQAVFQDFCRALDSQNWHYSKDESELRIECGARGDDLPMKLVIRVNPDIKLVTLISHIPFATPEDKRLDLAIAVSVVNNRLVDGCFDYDVKEGNMFFRMTNSFRDSSIGQDAFLYMIYCSCQTIDEYNDKFLMLAKGMISLEKFLELANN